jgi:redox-sensitive bicupin YhaK (pirin superfamily)
MERNVAASEITVRRSSERGLADHGWLRSRHTFSFADYYDPSLMGFRSLRVINDDVVAAGRGFPEHPHRDMEIFSYVLEGALAHRDSLGNERILTPGQIQLMSAGTGVRHSEFNPSATESTHFLQIWIQPRENGLKPSYTEWHPSPWHADDPKVLVISPDGRDGSAGIQQDAEIYRILLEPGQSIQHEVREGRGIWLHIAEGSLVLNGTTLETGDAAATEVSGTLTLTANSRTNALFFDLN